MAVALVLGVVVLGGVAVAGVRRGVGGGRVVGVGGLWRAWGVRGGVVKLNLFAGVKKLFCNRCPDTSSGESFSNSDVGKEVGKEQESFYFVYS